MVTTLINRTVTGKLIRGRRKNMFTEMIANMMIIILEVLHVKTIRTKLFSVN